MIVEQEVVDIDYNKMKLLENYLMICNQNEKYLLKFISAQNSSPVSENELLQVIYNLGIKMNFENSNPVYQIIDELNYANYHRI